MLKFLRFYSVKNYKFLLTLLFLVSIFCIISILYFFNYNKNTYSSQNFKELTVLSISEKDTVLNFIKRSIKNSIFPIYIIKIINFLVVILNYCLIFILVDLVLIILNKFLSTYLFKIYKFYNLKIFFFKFMKIIIYNILSLVILILNKIPDYNNIPAIKLLKEKIHIIIKNIKYKLDPVLLSPKISLLLISSSYSIFQECFIIIILWIIVYHCLSNIDRIFYSEISCIRFQDLDLCDSGSESNDNIPVYYQEIYLYHSNLYSGLRNSTIPVADLKSDRISYNPDLFTDSRDCSDSNNSLTIQNLSNLKNKPYIKDRDSDIISEASNISRVSVNSGVLKSNIVYDLEKEYIPLKPMIYGPVYSINSRNYKSSSKSIQYNNCSTSIQADSEQKVSNDTVIPLYDVSKLKKGLLLKSSSAPTLKEIKLISIVPELYTDHMEVLNKPPINPRTRSHSPYKLNAISFELKEAGTSIDSNSDIEPLRYTIHLESQRLPESVSELEHELHSSKFRNPELFDSTLLSESTDIQDSEEKVIEPDITNIDQTSNFKESQECTTDSEQEHSESLILVD